MVAMSFLGRGGLHSPNASSSCIFFYHTDMYMTTQGVAQNLVLAIR